MQWQLAVRFFPSESGVSLRRGAGLSRSHLQELCCWMADLPPQRCPSNSKYYTDRSYCGPGPEGACGNVPHPDLSSVFCSAQHICWSYGFLKNKYREKVLEEDSMRDVVLAPLSPQALRTVGTLKRRLPLSQAFEDTEDARKGQHGR